tara:strand:+ start:822 stop:1424 length:603 start_codon:yes stop_codon:yes gene_type:complete
LCGISTQDAALLIRKKFKKQSVKGSSTEQVLYVLKLFGYKSQFSFETKEGYWHVPRSLQEDVKWLRESRKIFHRGNSPTLTKWFEWHRVKPKDNEAYLVICGNHWMVEHKGLMYDNGEPNGIPVAESKMKKCRVVLAVKLTQRDIDTSKVLARIDRYNESAKNRKKQLAKSRWLRSLADIGVPDRKRRRGCSTYADVFPL